MVIIEGTDENIGQVTQAKSSYMPKEILWGYRFENLIKFDVLREEYEIDFSKFHDVSPVNTPLCSPVYNEQYAKMQKSILSKCTQFSSNWYVKRGNLFFSNVSMLYSRLYTQAQFGRNTHISDISQRGYTM